MLLKWCKESYLELFVCNYALLWFNIHRWASSYFKRQLLFASQFIFHFSFDFHCTPFHIADTCIEQHKYHCTIESIQSKSTFQRLYEKHQNFHQVNCSRTPLNIVTMKKKNCFIIHDRIKTICEKLMQKCYKIVETK